MAQQVEIVNPRLSGSEWITHVITGLFLTALRVLIVWWAVAAWFPEYGLTYWQLVLPVYAVRYLVGDAPLRRTAKS